MEQVVVESVFKVDKAVKAQLQLASGWLGLDKNSKKAEKSSSIFANNLKSQVTTYNQINARIEAYNKLLAKQEIGSKKFLETQKRIAELEAKKSGKKPEEKKDSGEGFGLASKAMIGIGAAIGVAYGALAGVSKAIPAIGQAMESMGETITRNLFMPLAQELLPVIMSIFQWVSKNRLVFVQLGTTFVQAFRLIAMAANAVLNLFKKFYGAFQKAIGGGQMTMQKFLGYVQLFSLKIAFIIAYLEIKLEGIIEFLGGLFGFLWKNAISPLLDGIMEGMTGVFDVFDNFSEIIKTVTDIFKKLGLTTDKQSTTMQKGFKTVGKFMVDFMIFPFKLFSNLILFAVKTVSDLIDYFKTLGDKLSNLPNPFTKMIISIKEIGSNIKSFWNELSTTASGAFDKAFNIGSNLKKQITEALSNGINDAWNFLKDSKGGKAIAWLMEKGSAVGGAISDTLSGARASGGSVDAGKSYIVGEKGAEIFQPNQSGTIIPNNKIQTMGNTANDSSGGQYVDSRQFNITVNGGNADEVVNKVKQLLNTKPDFKQGLRQSYARFQ